MQFNLHPLRNIVLEPLSTRDAELLLTYARALQRLADEGQDRPLLRGRYLALLSPSGGWEDTVRFCRAATDLGARVAHVRPELTPASTDADVGETGRMLGRLYDGIECLGLDPAVVRRLAAVATVPVYDGIASPSHPTAKLAAHLDAVQGSDVAHRYIIQAILLSTLN